MQTHLADTVNNCILYHTQSELTLKWFIPNSMQSYFPYSTAVLCQGRSLRRRVWSSVSENFRMWPTINSRDHVIGL